MKKKVSCHIITYNQENFISGTIDGILKQQTDFSIEIVIGDDNSTDGTRAILLGYAGKYPGIIRLNLREVRGQGIPGKDNFVSTLKMCEGEYVSLCDGDDYWTDPLKLQKQVDALEGNPDCVLCFTSHATLLPNGEIRPPFERDIAIKSSFEDLVRDNYIASLTVLLRRNALYPIPDWFNDMGIGDWPLYLWLMRKGGKAYYLKANTAVYRYGVGISTDMRKKTIDLNKRIMVMLSIIRDDAAFASHRALLDHCIEAREISLMKSLITQRRLLEGTGIYFKRVAFRNFVLITKTYFNSYLRLLKSTKPFHKS